MKKMDMKERILAENERMAERLRHAFRKSGTLVVNLISSPGSGKTSLLETTVQTLKKQYRMAALVGDIATERDADRLIAMGIPARQILTGGGCHLDARQIDEALHESKFGNLDLLFIENVGNLICPTTYDLGEDFKVALLSVTEGDDKPFKYPGIFSRAAVTVITKVDLMPYVDFDLKMVRDQIAILNPKGRLTLASVRSGAGIQEWCQMLRESHGTKVSLTEGAA